MRQHWSGPALDRRHLLAHAAGAASGALGLALLPGQSLGAAPSLGRYPFTLGVAAGDPEPEGAVLWTRLAPRPFEADGGMLHLRVPVEWRVAEDAGMRRIVRHGRASAMPELAHSVHVEVDGLRPGREYFYQFSYRSDESPVGRFRTTARPHVFLDRLDFAFATCQAWSSGFYTPYQDMVRQDLDVVFHLGDYIYEAESNDNNRGVTIPPAAGGDVPFDLTHYRVLHALYKSDPDLQAAHAAFAFVVIWDDHELLNDYAGEAPEFQNDAFLAMRAAAYQAFYEHLPLRRRSRPQGTDLRLYHRLQFGDLAVVNLLDTRQYRDRPPCGYGEQFVCADRNDPRASMLGREQEAWLYRGLVRSNAAWNLIAQQVLMAELDHQDEGERFWTDSWDGFPAARRRLVRLLDEANVANPVVITGDWHSTFVNDIKRDFRRERSPAIATELVTPAITTGGDDTPYGPYYGPMIPFNPHIKYYEGDRRGYFRARLTRQRLEADLRFVSTVESPTATARTERTFVVENGRPGALLATS